MGLSADNINKELRKKFKRGYRKQNLLAHMREWSGKEKKKDAQKYTRKKFLNTEQIVLSIHTLFDSGYFDGRNSRPLSKKGRIITKERVLNKSESKINEFSLEVDIKKAMVSNTPTALIKKIRKILEQNQSEDSIKLVLKISLVPSIGDAKKLLNIQAYNNRLFRYGKYTSSRNIKKILAILLVFLEQGEFIAPSNALESILFSTDSDILKRMLYKLLK